MTAVLLVFKAMHLIHTKNVQDNELSSTLWRYPDSCPKKLPGVCVIFCLNVCNSKIKIKCLTLLLIFLFKKLERVSKVPIRHLELSCVSAG